VQHLPDKPNPTTGQDGRAGSGMSFSGLEEIFKYPLDDIVASAPYQEVR
jgi:hypothetical protein